MGAENTSERARSTKARNSQSVDEALRTLAAVQDPSGHGVTSADQAQLLMTRRLDQVVCRAPVTCTLATPIHEVLDTLQRETCRFDGGHISGRRTSRHLHLAGSADPGGYHRPLHG